MANGVKALRKIQFGRNADSDSDDVIPATTIWRGTGTIEDQRNTYIVDEDVGILMGTDRTNTSKLGGVIALDAIEATYEQLPHLLEMNIKTVSPVSDSGEVYIYTYDFPTTAGLTFKPYTVEGGDNAGAEVMNYCYGQDFTLSGNEGEAWMMSGTINGKTVAPQAFTGALSLPAVNTMNFGKTKLYINDDSDDFGTTLVSKTLLQAQLSYKSGLMGKFTGDGELQYSFVQNTMPEVVLTVTFEHNAEAIAEKVDWRSENARVIRLLNQGKAFTSVGNTYAVRTCIIDLPGKWLKFNKIGDRNGNDVLEGTFQVRYNATRASSGKIIVANALSALP